METQTETVPQCQDCGRFLIVAGNGLTMCPTEDRPEVRAEPIKLLGKEISNPFSPTQGKNIYNIMHDRAHAARIKEWYKK